MADFDHIRRKADQMLGAQLGSATAREASRRAVKRGVREAGRRLRRAAILFVVLIGALILVQIFSPISFWLWLLALPTAFLAALLSMTFPTRAGRREAVGGAPGAPVVAPLDRLAVSTEDWLIQRSRALPYVASPALDRIVHCLRELDPSLGRLAQDSQLGGDAYRLLGHHLPGLVDTYLALPPAERLPNSEASQRLAESLSTVAEEMGDLCRRIGEHHRLGFDTERRFIETRYGEDETLRRG